MMAALGKVLFRMCIVVSVLIGGGMLLINDPQIQTWGVYILVGMVVVALVLRWIFRIFH